MSHSTISRRLHGHQGPVERTATHKWWTIRSPPTAPAGTLQPPPSRSLCCSFVVPLNMRVLQLESFYASETLCDGGAPWSRQCKPASKTFDQLQTDIYPKWSKRQTVVTVFQRQNSFRFCVYSHSFLCTV